MEKIPEINVECQSGEITASRDTLRSTWTVEYLGGSLELGDAALEELGADPEDFEQGLYGRKIIDFEKMGYPKEYIDKYSGSKINEEYYGKTDL